MTCFIVLVTNIVSAYEFPVHFSLTMWLAVRAGFDEAEAFDIAKYDYATDDDPRTTPIGNLDRASIRRRADFHFVKPFRLAQLEERAGQCTRDRRQAADYRPVGQYLHALEDSYSHAEYGPILGHAPLGTAPDKPWWDPQAFQTMVERKYEALLRFRTRCTSRVRTEAQDSAAIRDGLSAITAWVAREQTSPLGEAPSERWETLLRTLFGPGYPLYVETARRAYLTWKETQDREGWKP